jgi:predicted Zn-dependent protease
VLTRNHELGKEAAAQGFFGPQPSAAERERDLDRLEDARLLDPNAYWRVARANYLLLVGDTRAAAATAEALVRDEPENPFAWSALLQATRESDPARSEEAAAALKRLNPRGAG